MARKRTPNVIRVRKKPTSPTPKHPKKSGRRISYEFKEKTKKERVYKVIEDACCRGYRFTDNFYGLPFIELKDLEEKENGIYVIRFRCEPHYLHHVYFGRIAADVCKTLRSGLHFFHESKTEWGIPYEECVWVVQIGEQDNDKPIWRKLFMPETVIKTISPEGNRPHPRKCTHVRWDEFLQSHYSRSLLSVAQELGYSEQNLDILGGDFTNLGEKKRIYKKHKKLFDDFLADERNIGLMDGRQVYEYFKDLISGWIGEDLLVKALNEYGFNASIANADRDRVIKTKHEGITGEPDIKIEYEGNVRYLKLMDALSPVETFGQFDLRLAKAENQFNRKNLFLLHGLCDGKYVLIDFMRDNVTVTYNYPNPRYGNKTCSVVRLQENGIQMHDMSIFWESLRDIMLNTKPEPKHHYLKLVDYKTGAIKMLGSDWTENSSEVDDNEESDKDTSSDEEAEEMSDSDAESSDEQEEEPQAQAEEQVVKQEAVESQVADDEPPEPEIDDESSIIEEVEDGQSIAYTEEQWAALNDGF